MSRNRLDQETSPYLLQHRFNPVHWRAWGAEALAEAKDANKPILLSVGYAACHWCHVMAHESFEDEATAKLMNELFIPIKVDREERPDIDVIYQSALASLGQQGGWPLTMFLTPDGEPFWGGTYFPPTPRFGRPSFQDVLRGVADAHATEPEKITTNVSALKEALKRLAMPAHGDLPDQDLLDRIAVALQGAIDKIEGGLSGAPKFPQVPVLFLLWRAGLRLREKDFEQAVILSLDKMSQGGIYDHLGGGYSRYSTDEHWLAPHFEKMLYDNAQLIDLLSSARQKTANPLYAARVTQTIDWLHREMMADHQAFAATLDADSEGEEGKYYVWSEDEIDRALPADEAARFKAVYDVSAGGNWEGKSILNRNHRLGAPSDATVEQALADARSALLALRRQRIPPGRDDKVLADWNGMMIAALANASFVFDRPDWLATAKAAFDAIEHHQTSDGRLAHSSRCGRLQNEAMLDDYAQMARAALLLYEATGTAHYLAQAVQWTDILDRYYWDVADGGYFFTASDAEGLLIRTKSAFDQATPSGNAVMIEVLARLYYQTGRPAYREQAEAVMRAFAGLVEKTFPSMAAMLNAWDLLANAVQLVLIGPPEDETYRDMLKVITGICLPNLILTRLSADQPLPKDHPAFEKVTAASHYTPTAFICVGPVCSLPLSNPAELRHSLLEV
ncbi:thioredoxin domain-containing protein [Telmatospirillum siberiense]|uniref:Thioredoxin domain-containing protein n=1 Tax=Telmatospirillum siberiense TaxID=382514 RepID=A0A2N3PMZ8_9PROT|nr:thioredoxin domain-containing protein [Telmatospirillum siberiense]PKU21772.1 thioredoxin domain-containing protein [Telmatospirillum siberiense]